MFPLSSWISKLSQMCIVVEPGGSSGGGGGGGVLPYMGYIGTCRGIGYGF